MEGYEMPIGPLPQMVTNDLKSLDEMVSEIIVHSDSFTDYTQQLFHAWRLMFLLYFMMVWSYRKMAFLLEHSTKSFCIQSMPIRLKVTFWNIFMWPCNWLVSHENCGGPLNLNFVWFLMIAVDLFWLTLYCAILCSFYCLTVGNVTAILHRRCMRSKRVNNKPPNSSFFANMYMYQTQCGKTLLRRVKAETSLGK